MKFFPNSNLHQLEFGSHQEKYLIFYLPLSYIQNSAPLKNIKEKHKVGKKLLKHAKVVKNVVQNSKDMI